MRGSASSIFDWPIPPCRRCWRPWAKPRRSADVLGLPLAPGRGEFLELLLGHRVDHVARRALQFALRGLAALGGERGAGGLLLGGGLGRHDPSPSPGKTGYAS